MIVCEVGLGHRWVAEVPEGLDVLAGVGPHFRVFLVWAVAVEMVAVVMEAIGVGASPTLLDNLLAGPLERNFSHAGIGHCHLNVVRGRAIDRRQGILSAPPAGGLRCERKELCILRSQHIVESTVIISGR